MTLDYVHDLQRAFRKLLRAEVSPGEIQDLAPEAEKVAEGLFPSRGMLLIALALLDGETSFRVVSKDRERDEKTISGMTYAKAVPLENADFVFVLDSCFDAAGLFPRVRPGTLVDPHCGATIVLETPSLIEGERTFLLTGPGLREKRPFRPAGMEAWAGPRAEKNGEFPLGVDLFLVDGAFRAAALPRTTKAEE